MTPQFVSVVIPCLNEAETIAEAIREANAGIKATGLQGEVIISDNGSTDGSQKIATDLGARVVNAPTKGYGAAVDHGIKSAGPGVVVFADADLSYPFIEIPALVKPIFKDQADFVLGSRLKGTMEPSAMPFLNKHLGTPILSFLIRLLYKLPTSDCNSGMRALKRDQYDNLQLHCPGMEYASEMLIRLAQRGLKYNEVVIPFRKDKRNRPPHLRRWRDGWRHLRFILGNGPSSHLLVIPGGLGLLLMFLAFLMSFGIFAHSKEALRFHSAFTLIAISLPLMVYSGINLVIKSALHESQFVESRLVKQFKDLSDRTAWFFASSFFFFCAAVQIVLMVVSWYNVQFSDLFEIGGSIRLIIFATLGALLFSIDMASGLLRLLPFKKNN